MVQLKKLQQEEPEIRDDLQGRIEVFDQSIRGFEKRLRAVERRLSVETPQAVQPVKGFSENFSYPFPEENSETVSASSSIFPQVPSVFPESSIPLHGNSLLSNSVLPFSEGNGSSFALSAILPSDNASGISAISLDNSSESSGAGYKVININELFSNLSESLRSLQASISEISSLVHNNLEPEMERQDKELQNLRDQEAKSSDYIRKLESRIEFLENQNRLTFGSIKIPLEISGIVGSFSLFFAGYLIWSGRWDIIRSPSFPIGLAVLMAGVVFIKFYMVNRKKKSLSDAE